MSLLFHSLHKMYIFLNAEMIYNVYIIHIYINYIYILKAHVWLMAFWLLKEFKSCSSQKIKESLNV